MDRNFVKFVAIVLSLCAAAASALVLVLALLGMSGCSTGDASTWPESAEFSTLETGQDRFSTHGTNIVYWRVIVDHSTGVQYLYARDVGLCPLLDADGTPLLVAEAGE